MAKLTKEQRQKRAQRNRDNRAFYMNMGAEIGAALCTFCRYGFCLASGSCCDDGGYYECRHPLERISDDFAEEGMEPGGDCWGFSPDYPKETITEIVTAILYYNLDNCGFIAYSKTAVTLYGFISVEGVKGPSIKVRIGHDGPPDRELYDPRIDPCVQECGGKYWQCNHPCEKGRDYYNRTKR